MNIKNYIKGKGIDASIKQNKNIPNAKHIFIEPDNLYSLRNYAQYESLDFIYSKNLINETKFHRILIKEWLNFCKIGGHIIIKMKSNNILTFPQLCMEAEILIKNRAEILKKEYSNDEGILVIKKTKQILSKKDSISKWTFGIVADGRRDKEVTNMIKSIISLKIPYFEIIICGVYRGEFLNKFKNIKYVYFNPKKAWITKKKNIILQKARYENIVVTHDRFIFDKNWYKGMKKYGNYFEILSCIITDLKNNRVDDWITFGTKKDKDYIGNLGLLDYKDWDINGYIGGGFYILKKSVWKECKWDEKLVWGEAEDLKISRCFYNKGFIARFNPFSKCFTTSSRGKWFKFKLNKKRFIKNSDRSFPRRIKNMIRRAIKKVKIFLKKYK